MTRLRITVALLAATGLIAVLAAPVAAKGKPPKPSDPPVLMDVTMSGALSTTCEDGDGIDGVMVLARDNDGLTPAGGPVEFALLEFDIPGVDSTRRYDADGNLLGEYDADGNFIADEPSTGFTGCRGEQLDGSASPYGGLFITLDDTGAVTDLFWHFDYYLETTPRGKSGKMMVSLMEHFTLSGHELMWDAETSTASGWVNVLYHLEDSANQVSVGYEPVDGSPVFLEFTLTMTPHG
jgi:hypothetical protein